MWIPPHPRQGSLLGHLGTIEDAEQALHQASCILQKAKDVPYRRDIVQRAEQIRDRTLYLVQGARLSKG